MSYYYAHPHPGYRSFEPGPYNYQHPKGGDIKGDFKKFGRKISDPFKRFGKDVQKKFIKPTDKFFTKAGMELGRFTNDELLPAVKTIGIPVASTLMGALGAEVGGPAGAMLASQLSDKLLHKYVPGQSKNKYVNMLGDLAGNLTGAQLGGGDMDPEDMFNMGQNFLGNLAGDLGGKRHPRQISAPTYYSTPQNYPSDNPYQDVMARLLSAYQGPAPTTTTPGAQQTNENAQNDALFSGAKLGPGADSLQISTPPYQQKEGSYDGLFGAGLKSYQIKDIDYTAPKKRRGRPKKYDDVIKQVEIIERLPYEEFEHAYNPSLKQLLKANKLRKAEETSKEMQEIAKKHKAFLTAMGFGIRGGMINEDMILSDSDDEDWDAIDWENYGKQEKDIDTGYGREEREEMRKEDTDRGLPFFDKETKKVFNKVAKIINENFDSQDLTTSPLTTDKITEYLVGDYDRLRKFGAILELSQRLNPQMYTTGSNWIQEMLDEPHSWDSVNDLAGFLLSQVKDYDSHKRGFKHDKLTGAKILSKLNLRDRGMGRGIMGRGTESEDEEAETMEQEDIDRGIPIENSDMTRVFNKIADLYNKYNNDEDDTAVEKITQYLRMRPSNFATFIETLEQSKTLNPNDPFINEISEAMDSQNIAWKKMKFDGEDKLVVTPHIAGFVNYLLDRVLDYPDEDDIYNKKLTGNKILSKLNIRGRGIKSKKTSSKGSQEMKDKMARLRAMKSKK